MDELDFAEFCRLMPVATAMRKRPGVIDAFIGKYHKEISSVLVMLTRMGVAGQMSVLHSNPPTNCDCCDQPLAANDWFVDGATKSGNWSNMCPNCFWSEGEAIRFGAGQLYVKTPLDAWRLIGGGDPALAEDDR